MVTGIRTETDLDEIDRDLEERYGAYASYYNPQVAPAHVDRYGETPPYEELKRLLDVYAWPESRMLDLGSGSGFETCRLAARVAEVWGFDMDPRLLRAARFRAAALGLTNVSLVDGNVAVAEDLAALPAAHFDLVVSQRGPNLNENLMGVLRPNAILAQELVPDTDAFLLKEVFGRRAYAPFLPGPDGLLA